MPRPALTTEQIIALSVEDARAYCGHDEAEFVAFIEQVADGVARHLGFDLPTTEEARELLHARLAPMLVEDAGERFTFVVGKAVGGLMDFAPMPSEIIGAYNRVRTCADKRTVCHAPSTSLYFGRNGYATACCYSRANPLGRWPEQTVSEIWFGERISTMRGQLAVNVLPTGCETCADQLRAGNFKGLLAANFDAMVPAPAETSALARLGAFFRKPAPPEPVYPIRMEFELSNKCNLECAMCSGMFSSSIRANRENKPPLPQVYDSRYVEQLKPFIPHLKQAKFLGGEPFLIDIYYEIWELFIEMNPECEIVITTNGTVFTNKVKRVLEKLNFQVVVSLDSVVKPTYEAIRVNATLERTLENLAQLNAILQQRGSTTRMAVCPMASNWRELPGLVRFANERGMALFFNTVIFPLEASLKFLPREELVRVGETLRQGVAEPKNDLEARNYAALGDLRLQVEMWAAESTAPDPRLYAIR